MADQLELPYKIEKRWVKRPKRRPAYKPAESHDAPHCKCVRKDGNKKKPWRAEEGRCVYCGKRP